MRRLTPILAAAGICLGSSGAVLAQDVQPAQPAECQLHSRTSDAVHAIVAQYRYGFEGFDTLCARLNAENMGVLFSESYGPAGDRSVGLVMVRLYDRDTITLSRAYSSSIAVSSAVGDDVPGAVLMQAIEDALQAIAGDADTYVGSVRAEIAALRTVMRGQ